MKIFKLILFLLTLSICNFARAETYYVNTEVLNLRSCAGTDCKILDKLTSGSVVDVVEDKGEWVKVKTDKSEGFVIKRSLTNESAETGIGEIIFSVVLLVIFIFVAWFIYMLPARLAANNKNADKIYGVNLFFGWFPGIWPILLVAALIGESREN